MLRLLTLTAVSVCNGCQQVVWNSAAYETPSALLLPIYNCNLKDMWLERFVQKIQFMAIDNKTNSLNNENWDLFMTRFCIGERIFTINFCSIRFIDCIDRHFFWNKYCLYLVDIDCLCLFDSIQFDFVLQYSIWYLYLLVQFGNTTFIFDLVRDFFVAIISFWCNYFFKCLFWWIFVKSMNLYVW